MIKYIPNILTVARLIFIPFIISFIFTENYISALVAFTFSGITDILDGYLARKFDVISNFGKLIDPLADKLTQISIITSLTILSIIPTWILIIVFLKELILIISSAFLYTKKIIVFSKWYGKLTTILFYLAIVSSFLRVQFDTNNIYAYLDILLYSLAIISTIFSFVMYVKNIIKNKLLLNSDSNKSDIQIKKKVS